MTTVEIKTEITGNVFKLETSEGSSVSEGEILAILESMKMEIPVVSPEDGVVKALHVKEGDVITEGDVVATIEV